MPTKIKASDIFSQDEIEYIKFILKLYSGKVVDVKDNADGSITLKNRNKNGICKG